jgi:betaine lipid synthase
MDHLDWFSPDSEEVQKEVNEFMRVLAPGGMVFWRSASKKPWYNQTQVSGLLQSAIQTIH